MKHNTVCARIICAGLFALPLSVGTFAAEPGGCASFAWPVTTEIEWLKASDAEPAASGATLATLPGKAIALSLVPIAKAGLTAADSDKAKDAPADALGGVVHFAGLSDAATYQISLPKKGWINVVQNGKALKSSSHSGKTDCEGLRKSVRFEIAPGPFAVELSGFGEDAIKFTIRRAE